MEIHEVNESLCNAHKHGKKYAYVNVYINNSHELDVSIEYCDEYEHGRVRIDKMIPSKMMLESFSSAMLNATEIASNVNEICSRSVDAIRDAHVFGADYERVSNFMFISLHEAMRQIESYAEALCERMLGSEAEYEICEIAAVESGSIELRAMESFGEVVREHLKLNKSAE